MFCWRLLARDGGGALKGSIDASKRYSLHDLAVVIVVVLLPSRIVSSYALVDVSLGIISSDVLVSL